MQLHYRLFAKESGAQPLVLLHGLLGSLENVGMLARLLADQFAVYCVDLPNHGRSPALGEAGLAQYALAIKDFLTQQNLSSAHLVGHSLGGKIAMEVALANPDEIAKLVVLDISPVQYSSRHEHIFAGLSAIALEQISSRAEAEQVLSDYEPEPAVRSFLLKNLYKDDDHFAWRMNLAELQASYHKLIGANRQGVFAGPTLFLKGEQSDYIHASHRDQIKARFPQAQLRVIADTQHWLHAEKPQATASVIKRFLLASDQFAS